MFARSSPARFVRPNARTDKTCSLLCFGGGGSARAKRAHGSDPEVVGEVDVIWIRKAMEKMSCLPPAPFLVCMKDHQPLRMGTLEECFYARLASCYSHVLVNHPFGSWKGMKMFVAEA
tara:strand:- start:1270 stop:1623 length:354 start_codon:yes stop_codon:yes gene_type:complete